MRLIFFLCFLLPEFSFSQLCTLGYRYHPDCKAGTWCDCIKGYSDYHDKKTGEQWCLCDSLKNIQDYAKSFGLLKGRVAKLEASDKRQNAQISEIQKKDIAQDIEINNIKSDVNNLKEEIMARPADVTLKSPTIDEVKPEKPTEKQETVKKPDPKLGDPIPLPTETVYKEPWFFIKPQIGLIASKTKSPEFDPEWSYAGEAGIQFVIEPKKLHGFGMFVLPKYLYGLNKNFIPESGGTAYVQPKQNLSGVLLDACFFYKYKYTEIFTGYSFGLTKDAEHHSGFVAGLESGYDFHSKKGQTLQLRGLAEVVYLRDLNFTLGIVARLPIKFKPKA